MSDISVKPPQDIPQRKDIEDKYKWDLTAIFKDNAAWEEAFKKAGTLIEKAKDYAGKLKSSSETLYACLESRSELSLLCHNLYQYAKLNKDLDNRVSEYQAMTDRAAAISSQAEAAFAFVEPELMQIDDDDLRRLADGFPQTEVYDFYIENLLRTRPHVRSGEVEELLARASLVGRGPSSVFTMIDNADVKYGSVKDENDNDVPLTKQRFIKFMDSPDQRVRKDAHEVMHEYYKNHVNTISAALSTEVNKNIFFARARNYNSSLEAALDTFAIPPEVYRSLIETTRANLDGLHKWMAVRKKVLKLDKLFPYDIYCPLLPEMNYEVTYEQAIEKIYKAVEPLGKEYRQVMEEAFANRWVDVYETEGKSGGAYNWGNYEVHPFIKMNYNNTIDNMFTLAHEMGHAMHSYFSSRTQPYPKAQYSIFVAEVASTLNEGLLLKYLLSQAKDDREKLFLLNRHINNTSGTFFTQVFFADFELRIHEEVEKGGALSPDLCNRLYADLTRKFNGEAMTLDDHTPYKWSRIPHFYMNFYVYQYATSYAASQAIMEKFNAGESGLIDKYLTLLSSGGADYPINQLKACGIDMTAPKPVEATLKLFADQVDQFERLIGD